MSVCALANAQIELRSPSPNNNAWDVGQPTLFWSVAAPNLLSNGSFEEGTNGWILPARSINVGQWRIAPRTSAYDGTNMLMVFGGTVAHDVTLPQTTSAIMWTFGARGIYATTPTFTAEVQTPEGEVLKRQDFLRQGHELSYYDPRFWRGAVDLSAYAGRTVRLALIFPSPASEISVDDWRVEVFPEGALFDVYVMEPLTTRMVKLARTQGGSVVVTNLWSDRAYQWRVDTIYNGQTNTGPIWTFRTALPGRPENLEFARIPDFVCPGRELSLNLYLLDTNGLALFPNSSTLTLFAAADNVPPTAIITEVNVSTNAEIEVVNVSTNFLDVSRWRVHLLYPKYTPGIVLFLPTNAVLAPGEIFTMRQQDFGGVWPHLGLPGSPWRETNTSAGVVLRDSHSNLVDCVFIDRRATNTVGWGSQRFRVATEIDWRGPVLENAAEDLTFQRIGNLDSNTRDDWIAAPPSIGAANAGLTMPFEPSFGRVPARFGGNTNIVKGIPTLVTSVTFPMPLSNVWLSASQPIPATAEVVGFVGGVSKMFQVTDPDHCMSLIADEGVLENAGRAIVNIELGAPAENDVIVQLTLSETADASAPGEVRVPAGAAQASFEIQLTDNNTLEGPRSFTINATAPQYSETQAKIYVRDDEKPVLTITAPDLVREGEPAELVITSSMAPVVPIQLQITSPAPIAGARELPAGTNKIVLYVGGQDDFLQGNGRLTVKVEALDWQPATAEFDYIDKTVGQLSMIMPQQIVEGGAQKMSISLGAAPASQRQFKLTTSRPDLILVPNETTMYPGVLQTEILLQALPAAGPDRVEEVQIIASADGFDSVTNVVRVLIEETDSGQIVSAAMSDDGQSLVIRFTTRADWKYSLGRSYNIGGSWFMGNDPALGDGQIKEFSINRADIITAYPNFFRIFREPPPL